MKYDAKEFKNYPEIMNKEQMRIACHISKQTALYLLQFNLIPHTCTGKKTRCYAIKKSDVIAFMNDREVNPEKYIAPKNWYKYGSEMVRPYKIRIHPPCAKDEKKLRRYTDASGLPVYLSENELLGVAEDIAARLNADIISTEYKRVEDTAQLSPNTGLSGGEAWRLTAKTREHTILVSGNGNAVVEFNTQGVLFSDYTSENEAKTTIGTLLEKYASLLNVDEPVIYTWCDYTFTGEQLRRYFVYEDDTDPVQKILNYNFCLIGLTPSEEGGELSNVSFQNNLSCTNKIGDYPIITSDAAREMLLNGEYITTVPSEYLHDTGISEEMIAKEELVYRTENVNEIFMPYYRYYIELKESGVEMADGLKLYGVYYVPAVSAEYLVDFPIWDGSFN